MRRVLAALGAVVAAAALAHAAERPKARAFLDAQKDLLPGWAAPWTVQGVPFQSEAEWRRENVPPSPEAVRTIGPSFAQVPDEALAESREMFEKLAGTIPSIPGASRTFRSAMVDAILRAKSKQEIGPAVEREFRDVTDAWNLCHFRSVPLPTGRPDDPPPQATGLLTIEMHVWSESGVRDRAADADLDGAELIGALDATRASMKKLMGLLVAQKNAELDEDIETALAGETPDLAEVQRLYEEKAELSKAAFAVHGDRPGHGDASHWIAVERGALLDAPRSVSVNGALRRGVAVFVVSLELAGSFAEDWRKTTDALFKELAARAKPYAVE